MLSNHIGFKKWTLGFKNGQWLKRSLESLVGKSTNATAQLISNKSQRPETKNNTTL